MTSPTDAPLKKMAGFLGTPFLSGGVIYTILAVALFAESTSPILAWISAISAPGGYFAWVAWKRDKRNRDGA
jgi:hypothetical protein